MTRVHVRVAARSRLALGALAVGALLAAALVGPSAPAVAAAEACWSDADTDVDGGGPDIVVGLPSYDLPGKPDAGAIAVWSNVGLAHKPVPKSPTSSRIYTADDIPGLTSQAGARFGAAVSLWQDWGDDDDADECADVLVGAPGQNVGGKSGAGAVDQVTGAPGGFDGVRHVITEDSLGVTGGAQAGAEFGAAIAAETIAALAVGAPGRDVGGHTDAGRVVKVDSWDLPSQKAPLVIEQGGLASGAPEKGDRFGEVIMVSATGQGVELYVGAPHEDVGSKTDAGAVFLVPTTGDPSSASQDTSGAGGTAEAGDRYGQSLTPYWTFNAVENLVGVVAVGIPGEDVGRAKNAGAVGFASFLGATADRDAGPLRGVGRVLTQDSPTIPGTVEAGDAFGNSVLDGTFSPYAAFTDLVIASPLENVGRAVDAGQISQTRIDPDATPQAGVDQTGAWSQDSAGVANRAEAGDRFGAQVSSVLLAHEIAEDEEPWLQLVVTVPREDVDGVKDAGLVYVGRGAGQGSVALVPPVLQAGAGIGMAPMHIGQQ